MLYEVYQETLTQKDGNNAVLLKSSLTLQEAEIIKGADINKIIVPQHIGNS